MTGGVVLIVDLDVLIQAQSQVLAAGVPAAGVLQRLGGFVDLGDVLDRDRVVGQFWEDALAIRCADPVGVIGAAQGFQQQGEALLAGVLRQPSAAVIGLLDECGVAADVLLGDS